MQSPSVTLPLTLLSWADSLQCRTGLLYRPAMQKTSQIFKFLAPTKYRRPPKFHWFLPNYSSLYICSQASCKKLVKTKSDHHHCPLSVYALTSSKIDAIIEIHRWGLCTLQTEGGGRGRGGEGELRGGGGVSKKPSCPCFHLLSQFILWSLFRLSPGCCEAYFDKYWIEMIRKPLSMTPGKNVINFSPVSMTPHFSHPINCSDNRGLFFLQNCKPRGKNKDVAVRRQ